MEPKRTLQRITRYVIGASIALTALAFVLGGLWTGVGAAVGAALAIGNWVLMRFVGQRLLVATDAGRIVWGAILMVKMGVLLAIAWAVLSTGAVDPIGFSVGVSGLVFGLLLGAFHSAYTRDSSVVDPGSEEEVS